MSYSISALGDSALIVDFGNIISLEINTKVLLLVKAIERAGLIAIKDIVPAYSSVTIHYDVIVLLRQHKNKSAFTLMSEQMEALLSQPVKAVAVTGRRVQVPVCYSLRYGWDLPDISAQTRLSVEEIIHLHTKKNIKFT